MIQFELAGKSFLDLFAGTGAVGLEALSRGAASAVFVENAPRAAAALERNIKELACANARVVRRDVFAYLAGAKTQAGKAIGASDFIFADPPYDLLDTRPFTEWMGLLPAATGTVFILEMRASAADLPAIPAPWELVRDRTYGQSRILLFRNKPVASDCQDAASVL